MKQSWQDKVAMDIAREWLEKHEPKRKQPRQKPKPKALKLKRDGGTAERWQMRRLKQMQERQIFAKPLLKGVE